MAFGGIPFPLMSGNKYNAFYLIGKRKSGHNTDFKNIVLSLQLFRLEFVKFDYYGPHFILVPSVVAEFKFSPTKH